MKFFSIFALAASAVVMAAPTPEVALEERTLNLFCAKYWKFNLLTKKCEPGQAPDCNTQVWSWDANKCIDPSCNSGYKYDLTLKKCVEDIPTCHPGQKYDAHLKKCVDDIPQCASGEHYDYDLYKCVADRPTCSHEEVYNAHENVCEPVKEEPTYSGCQPGYKKFLWTCVIDPFYKWDAVKCQLINKLYDGKSRCY